MSDTDSESVTINLTLANLRKTIDKFKTLVKPPQTNQNAHNTWGMQTKSRKDALDKSQVSYNSLVLFRFAKDFSDVKESYDRQVATAKHNFTRKLTISHELATLKDQLFAANAKYGIDTVLTSISQLENEKQMLSEILSQIDLMFPSILLDHLYKEKKSADDLAEKNNEISKYSGVDISLFEKDSINTRIKEIAKELTRLEDKRNEMNWSHKISISLSKESVDLLGLSY